MRNPIKKFIFSFLLAVLAYLGLISAEKSFLEDYEPEDIVRTKIKIEQNTEFTKENVGDFFYVDEVPAKVKIKNSVTAIEEVIGSVSSTTLEEGELVLASRLVKKKDLLHKIIHPVEVSIEADNLSQVVGGILRQGDLINISVLDHVTKSNVKVLEYVYVEKVFDTNGQRIEKSHQQASAYVLNVIIDRSQLDRFNEIIAKGEVCISKVNEIVNVD